jgi:prepilin-type N-terminal cleavage/methylation domain-containing protein
MKKINNESGFSAVELILVIAVIALLAVVGWMVYKDHHKTITISTKSTATGLVKYTSWASTPNNIRQGVLVAWVDASPNYKAQPTSSCNTNTPSQSFTDNNPIYAENSNYIVAAAGCPGDTSTYLVVKDTGVWKDVGNTQFDFNCDTLTQYKVPTDLIVEAMQATATQGHVQCVQANGVKNLS